MDKTDRKLESWIKQGLELGMVFVDVYAPDEDKAPKAVVFARSEEAFDEFKDSL